MTQRNWKTRVCLFLSLILAVAFLSYVQAQQQSRDAADSRKEFNRLLVELEKNRSDHALRERIIKFAQTLNPPPVIPEEARRHFANATTFQREAKDVQGYRLAISEYKQALRIAPWWVDAYYALSQAAELANRPSCTLNSLKLYLLGTGNLEERANDAKKRLDALEARTGAASKLAQTDRCIGCGQTCTKYGTPCCDDCDDCTGKFPNYTCQDSW